jgi:hypothetical protein
MHLLIRKLLPKTYKLILSVSQSPPSPTFGLYFHTEITGGTLQLLNYMHRFASKVCEPQL